MAESTLSLKYSTLREKIGHYLGYTRTSGNWSSAQAADILDALESGLRQFYHPPALQGSPKAHKWSFLEPTTTLTTSAAYNTGTIAIASGVVTLTSGTFPSWAADGELTVNGSTYTVNTRDGNTQITLDDTSVTVSSGATYVLARAVYTLPDDFGALIGEMTYRDRTTLYPPVRCTSAGEVLKLRQVSAINSSTTSSRPVWCAVRPLATAGTGQRFEMIFWPTPGDAYTLEYTYHAIMNTLSSDQYPPGGEAHSETILESCLAIAEERLNGERGLHFSKFMERLKTSVDFDKRQLSRNHLPPMMDTSDGPSEGDASWHHRSANYVTVNGVIP